MGEAQARTTAGSGAVKVRHVMSNRVARIRADSSVLHAAEAIAIANTYLMVIDSDGGFAGVLSPGDVLRAGLPDIEEILEAGGSLDGAFARFLEKARDLSEMPIDRLVIRDPLTLDPDDHVAKAAVALIERGIRVLPVVRDGRLIGTVSRADICAAVVGELVGEPAGVD